MRKRLIEIVLNCLSTLMKEVKNMRMSFAKWEGAHYVSIGYSYRRFILIRSVGRPEAT